MCPTPYATILNCRLLTYSSVSASSQHMAVILRAFSTRDHPISVHFRIAEQGHGMWLSWDQWPVDPSPPASRHSLTRSTPGPPWGRTASSAGSSSHFSSQAVTNLQAGRATGYCPRSTAHSARYGRSQSFSMGSVLLPADRSSSRARVPPAWTGVRCVEQGDATGLIMNGRARGEEFFLQDCRHLSTNNSSFGYVTPM
eukprot:COSAG01_NODE_2300_length_7954_cov_7.117250_6_plen_198_part_00